MNTEQIIETAIQGHASTRDAIRWAIQQEREACAKVCEEKKSRYEERASRPKKLRDIKPEVVLIAGMTCDFNAAAIRARGNE